MAAIRYVSSVPMRSARATPGRRAMRWI